MRKLSLAVCIAASVLATTSVEADGLKEVTSMFDYEVTLDYYSHYIWRGQHLNESSFQPGVTVAYEGLTAGWWGSLDLTNETGHNNAFTEVDWYLDYSGDVPGMEGVSYSVGLIYYNFAVTQLPDTTEFYWGLYFDVPFSPGFTVYHDLDEAEGTYVSFEASHTKENIFELSSDVPVDMEIGASIGWGTSDYNNYYWGVDDGGFNDLNVSVAFPFEVGGWTMSPSVNWTMVVDSSLRDMNSRSQLYDNDNCYVYFGFGVSKSF